MSKKISFQDVKFRDIDDFFEYIQHDELKMVQRLRKLVFDCVPEITEKLSYNVPFYSLHRGMFFIWPGSVKWGKKQTWSGVRFGFQRGYLLTDDAGYLDKEGRKQVYWKTFSSMKEIDEDILKAFIFEAVIVDQKSPVKS